MASPPPEESRSMWDYLLPWRWAWLGWIAALAFMVAGVPLFLRMPLWCDANLYDTAAYNLLSGGTHYRDVFDTNLPGFVGILTGVRAVLGPSSEAVRAVDLAFVAAILFVMLLFLERAGAFAGAQAWAMAGVASFYLFISEFNHLQRDVWMMLPVLMASYYRFGRVKKAAGPSQQYAPIVPRPAHEGPRSLQKTKPANEPYVGRDWTYAAPKPPEPEPSSTPRPLARKRHVSDLFIFRTAMFEGMIWAAAFWIKPHVVVMAVAAWLVMAMRLAGTTDRPVRRLFVDLLGVVLGGALIGGAGIAWLILSGTWDPFLEVFQKWNVRYFANVLSGLDIRFGFELTYFPPWSMLTLVAVPFAVLNILDGRIWSRRWERLEERPPGFLVRTWRWFLGGPRDESARTARALFSAIYLSWVGMALFLQREFHYAHVPEVILMTGVFATNGWAINFLCILWQVLSSALILAAMDRPENAQWQKDLNQWDTKQREFDPERYWAEPGWYYANSVSMNPAFDLNRMKWWKPSIQREVTRELRNGVAFSSDFHVGVDSVQLGAVEDFLRKENVKDGEVLCWHDSPHALYRKLGIKPGFRFMHVTTASEMGPWQYEQVKAARDEAQPRLRFVVYDLYRVLNDRGVLEDLAQNQVPRRVPPLQRTMFPLNQPIVFHSPSGRYVVAEVKQNVPLGECRIAFAIGAEKLQAADRSHTWYFSDAQFEVKAAPDGAIPAAIRSAVLGSDRPAREITGGWEVDPATGTLKLSGIAVNGMPAVINGALAFRDAAVPTAPAGPDRLKIAGVEYHWVLK